MSASLILLFSSDATVVEAVREAVASTRRELRHLASDYGAMAVLQATGSQAVLALVDFDPTLHAFELCRAAAQHMPVIAVLGPSIGNAKESAREHGACGFLEKPVETARVRTVLDETLGVEAPVEL